MTSFVFRDRRLVPVQKALARLAALPPGVPPPMEIRQTWIKALRSEEAQLKAGQYEVSDEFGKAVAGGWIRQNAAALINAANRDIALRSLGQSTTLTAAMADRVKNLPASADPDAVYFDRVVQEIGDDQAADLAVIALGAWLQTPALRRVNPYRDIAVMMPLRLETLFKRQSDGTWKLLLRVIPDEPSILRDEKIVSKAEADYLQKFWQRSKAMTILVGTTPANWIDKDNKEGNLAWAELCDRIGAPRAAWMMAEFPPQIVSGRFVCTVPANRIGDHPSARVSGLPPKLNVVAFDQAGTRLDIGSLSPSDNIPVSMDNIKKEDAPTAKGNWLTDWNEAKKVGLGGEFTLPAGFAPNAIAALYVHGLGDQEPLAHFAAHANSGVMGLLALGLPTNAVEGAPTAELGKDPDLWRDVAKNRLLGKTGSATANLGTWVCGGTLPDVPGVTFGGLDSHRLAQALWPALWGHYFRDIWGCGDQAHELWAWVNGYLWPEGPLPPLRIDAQPYGLLPVMALEKWERGDNRPADAAEERIVEGLRQLVPQWALQAEAKGKGTVVDADESRLLDLLGRTGVSSNYDYRIFVDAALLADIFPGEPRFAGVAFDQWKTAFDVVGKKPAKIYSSISGVQPLELPLINASRMPRADLKDLFKAVYDAKVEGPFADRFFASDERRAIIADSLLIRLMLWSAFVAKAWYMQSVPGPTAGTSLLNPKAWDAAAPPPTVIESAQANFVGAFGAGLGSSVVGGLLKQQRGATEYFATLLSQRQGRAKDPYDPQQEVATLALKPDEQANLERALRATLDTASHRVDPWATGVAWHRLQQQSGSGRAHRRLGAYGWLDGPFLGQPGPNEAGRLHAPSYDQALTSIILRDKYLSSKNEIPAGGSNIWETRLNSASVRMALDIAQDIKMGFHVYEVIGRRVEEIVANGKAPIDKLREKAPLRAKPDPRDVCNGLVALKALRPGGTGVPGVVLNADQKVRLDALEAGLAAFSDLLLAEGVYNVVGGRPEQAADAMDSAAGFARPPDFGVVKTPPSGYRLTTNVVSAMPFRPPVTQGTPLELADASLAAFLSTRFGKPAQWIFRARWKENNVDQARDVDLASLQLKPLDAVLIPPDFLTEIVRRRLKQPQAAVDQPAGHRLMRQVAGTFGAHPALSTELAAVPNKDLDAPIDGKIQQELLARYTSLHAAASTLAASAAADRASRIAFLRKALSWGIIGTADPKVRQSLIDVMFENSALGDSDLAGLVTAAQAALLARIKDAPGPTDAKTKAMSAAQLARAIGNLVMPDGRLAITARWSVPDFRGRTGVRNPEPSLDTDWLPVVAVVRPPLARLEALQLEASTLAAFDTLATWSSCETPGDPWRTQLVGDNKLKVPGDTTGKRTTTVGLNMSRMTNVYGAIDAFNGTDVAVGGIDQFSEAVPLTRRKSYAAFGFNAPAARAPQAILLAVPGRIDMRLGDEECLQILIETRQLAHARAVRIDETSNPVAPTMWFQSAGPLRVRLDTGTQYTRW